MVLRLQLHFLSCHSTNNYNPRKLSTQLVQNIDYAPQLFCDQQWLTRFLTITFTMMVKFKIFKTKKEFKTDIPIIPLVGETITVHESNSGVYKVKSIEHEIKGGFYNTCSFIIHKENYYKEKEILVR